MLRRRRSLTSTELQEQNERLLMDTVAERASFYRANPHRFAKEYLGLNLHIFQQILLFMMNMATNAMVLASRGQYY